LEKDHFHYGRDGKITFLGKNINFIKNRIALLNVLK